ncbi:MAG TPA: hypothetical protein VGB63_16230 [Pedobacter sp.]|jgi:hypothetical protein
MGNLKEMGRIIKLTILTDIGSCIAMFIVLTFSYSFGMALYGGILTFGNIMLPTLVAALMYRMIKHKIVFKTDINKIIFQSTILCGLFILGLFIWAAGEAALLRTLTWVDIDAIYDQEFAGYLPVVFSEAVLLPTIDLFLTRRERKNI